MNLEIQSRLSFYKKIADLGVKENISIVQHIETKQVYVEKVLDVYDKHIYEVLMKENIPMIPKIYECLEADGRLYVIEELLTQCITLEGYIGRYGCLSHDDAKNVIFMLCSVLDRLHNRDNPIIHRDIKPTNIMVQEDAGRITGIYLIDFNTSRQFVNARERDTIPMGTMGFAAPEQYGFGQSDVRTDIYALGVLINFMMCGKLLSDEVYAKGDDISGIIARATKIAPEQRYQNVREIEKALCGYRNFLPPGFREGNPSHMLIAGIYYVSAIVMSACLEITSEGEPVSKAVSLATRITCMIIFLSFPLIWGNYLGIWEKLPLMKQKGWRVVGFVVYPMIIFLLLMIWLTIFENLFLT